MGPTRRIKNLETGEVFPNIVSAAISIGAWPSSFHRAVSNGRKSFGEWEFLDPPRVGFPVRCVETGEEFHSATAAAAALKTTSAQVLKSARKHRPTSTGQGPRRFEFVGKAK